MTRLPLLAVLLLAGCDDPDQGPFQRDPDPPHARFEASYRGQYPGAQSARWRGVFTITDTVTHRQFLAVAMDAAPFDLKQVAESGNQEDQ